MSLFEAFDEQFKGIKPAEKYDQDRIPPSVYKAIFVTQNLKGDGVLVDREVVDNRPKGGKLGLKLFLEILAPESVVETIGGVTEEKKTKGKIVEHIFWISDKTVPYIMKDVLSICGVDLQGKFSKIDGIAWAGNTVEIGVKDDEYNGWVRSRVNFFNAWKPEGATAAAPTGGSSAPPASSGGQGRDLKF